MKGCRQRDSIHKGMKCQSDSEWQPTEFPAGVITANGIGPLGLLMMVMVMVLGVVFLGEARSLRDPEAAVFLQLGPIIRLGANWGAPRAGRAWLRRRQTTGGRLRLLL